MPTNTLIAFFVPTGCNATLERQYLKIVSDYSVTTSGRTATATIVSTMYVHRDDRYSESTGKKASECYISIDGVKQYVVENGTRLPDITSEFVQIGDPVTYTVTYDVLSSKDVEIGAHFDITESGHKLNNLVIPVSSYDGKQAEIESGSTILTLPAQITDSYAYIANDEKDPELHLLYIHDEIDPEQPFGKYTPYFFDGASWQQYS